MSGVPSQVIKAYADGAERIKAAFSAADENTFRMAQVAKQQYVNDIISTRGALNDVIGKGIEDSNAVIKVDPIVKSLQNSMSKLNPTLDAPQIDEIKGMIKKVNDISFNDGTMPVQQAQQLKATFAGNCRRSISGRC